MAAFPRWNPEMGFDDYRVRKNFATLRLAWLAAFAGTTIVHANAVLRPVLVRRSSGRWKPGNPCVVYAGLRTAIFYSDLSLRLRRVTRCHSSTRQRRLIEKMSSTIVW